MSSAQRSPTRVDRRRERRVGIGHGVHAHSLRRVYSDLQLASDCRGGSSRESAARGSIACRSCRPIATRRPRGRPVGRGLGRGWGLGSGVVVVDGERAHQRPQPPSRGGDRDVRRRPPRDAPVAGRTSIQTASWPSSRSRPATHPGALGAGGRARRRHGGGGVRQPRRSRPARRRSASCRRPRRAASAARAAGGSRGTIEHTAPLPRGSSGGPLVDPAGNLLGLNTNRLDGGLILAARRDAAARERVDAARTRRGARPASARRGGRAAARGPPHAAGGRPARARRPARPRGRGGRAGGRRRHRARRPDRRGGGREIDGVEACTQRSTGSARAAASSSWRSCAEPRSAR